MITRVPFFIGHKFVWCIFTSSSQKSWSLVIYGGVRGVTQPGRLELLPMYEHIEAETREHGVLELGVVVHDDRDNSHIGEEAPSTTNNILRIEQLSKYALVKELNS